MVRMFASRPRALALSDVAVHREAARVTVPPPFTRGFLSGGPSAPDYLVRHYWWAYVHPLAVRGWDHGPVVNTILYGHYGRLRDDALDALGPHLCGRTLQVTCCYGDFTPRLADRVARAGGSLDVIDVLPVQLSALKRKLSPGAPVRTALMDATDLRVPDATYDRTVVFFLLHELPREQRKAAFREVLRVTKPGSEILIVDFGKPARWHPFRYLWLPFLGLLEPFARDLWNHELEELMPEEMGRVRWTARRHYFGGLFRVLKGGRLGLRFPPPTFEPRQEAAIAG